jgi:ABC-type polysaccharide/polyol phosphate transport system ATPase subunit
VAQIDVENLAIEYWIANDLRLLPPKRQAKAAGANQQIGGNFAFSGHRRRLRALDGVSFSLKAGDRMGLIGPNGAGKSTLLMALAEIYQPSEGSIRISGRVDALFNIRLGFRPEARMASIIEFSELGDFIDMPLSSYSQGMAARLAFAIVTAVEFEVLLLDEWIGAGDPEFQEKARLRMDQLVASAGILVLASHNHQLIRNTCNKVMRLVRGKVSAFGTVDEVLGPLQNKAT